MGGQKSKKRNPRSSRHKAGEHRDYRRSTERSRRIFSRARKILPKGVESNFRIIEPYPFYVTRGEGSRIWDIDGNEYLDFLMSQGVILLGHNNPRIRKAVARQIENGMSFALPTEQLVRAAELITNMMPSIEMLRFANSGTEATMHAVRVARGFTGKEKIAKCEGGYHGVNDQLMWSVYGPADKLGDRREPTPCVFSKGVPECNSKLIVPIMFNDIESTERVLSKHADSLAALIMEPVLANAGCLLPRDGYLKDVAKICRENDILLIFDEIITGFRLGPGGAQAMYGVTPDMTCLGKAVGGGMPVAAFGGEREIMESIIPDDNKWPMSVFHGGTYNAHPVGMAATIAALETFKEGRFYGRLNRLSDNLFRGLGEITRDAGLSTWVSHVGSMGFIYFSEREVIVERDTHLANWDMVFKFSLDGLRHGVLFGHPKGEKIFLSAAHKREDVEIALEVAKDCFK